MRSVRKYSFGGWRHACIHRCTNASAATMLADRFAFIGHIIHFISDMAELENQRFPLELCVCVCGGVRGSGCSLCMDISWIKYFSFAFSPILLSFNLSHYSLARFLFLSLTLFLFSCLFLSCSTGIYQRLFCDSAYGLTTEAVANNVLPLLIPHTINPHLNLDQYCFLLEVCIYIYVWVCIWMCVNNKNQYGNTSISFLLHKLKWCSFTLH